VSPANDLVIDCEHSANRDSAFAQPFSGFFDGGLQKLI
jgi:hypothetical protein